ncbi:Glycosyltransferase involved in cell wall bisynthesis [Desulfocicer vacuolatum DSM 3385]|uniref:Glycosyltransferase involved in cell wall bisynthesis n=1 Tax=Desulfocicer vacuolatum DSM 3385 TaxID=1121400 RepID=A0A1W1ZPF5_9BACT|nr:glycosyltransferase [Desulfocicer vacuolatum]SMC50237.1 Glycosyltransferase involved in cell wall bisynthesis [Desulfocicer vacuolatum DSM 3385]
MNILHVIDTSGPGGAETVFLDMVTRIDPTRFHSIPVVSNTGWLFDQLTKKGFSPVVVKSRGSFALSYLRVLVRLVRKYRIDLIHSHLFGANVYCSIAGIITRTPVIATFHGYVDVSGHSHLLKFKFKIINWGARRVVFVSHGLKNTYVERHGIRPRLTQVIYNGVNTQKFRYYKDSFLREAFSLSPRHILIGSVGNIREPKGYDVLLQAAFRLKKKIKDVKFFIAGEGSGPLYERLLALRKDLGLETCVLFIGFLSEPVTLLNGVDIFLLPSRSEGFSIATIEAMACGKPVVVTKSGGPEEIIADRSCGILIEPENPDVMADTLLDLINGPDVMDLLGRNAVRIVEARFSIAKSVEKYQRIYHEFHSSP